MNWPKSTILTLFALCLFNIFSCVTPPDLTKNTVVFYLSSQPDGLHPFNNNSGNRTIIFNYTQRTLVKLDFAKLKTFPVLVESMPEISEDKLKYTYRLKDGIFWDDGEKFTAKDVLFTTKMQVCPLTDNAAIRTIYDSVIKDVILYDDDPLKFTMVAHKVHATNTEIYTEIYMQQQSYWDPDGVMDRYDFEDFYSSDWKPGDDIKNWIAEFNNSDNSFKPENLAGLGPYKVTQWVTDNYIKLEKKQGWFATGDESPYNQTYPDEILFRIILDGPAAKMEVKNKRLDVVTQLGVSSTRKLKRLDYFNEAYDAEYLDEYAYAYIGLNCKPNESNRPPYFDDARTRRALAYATPVDDIIEVMYFGLAKRQVSNVSPLKPSYNDDLKPIPFDLDKARALLDEVGWEDTDGDNIRDKMVNGKKLKFSFDLHYFGNSTLSKEMALMVKEEYYKIGVEAKTVPLDFTILYKRAYEHDFDAMFGVWGGSGGYSDPIQLWHTDSWINKGSNFFGFGDAESDGLIEKVNKEVLAEDRIAPMQELQKKIYDEQPYIFLYSRVRSTIISKRFDNRDMYNEKPGLHTNNLRLSPEFGGTTLKPEEI